MAAPIPNYGTVLRFKQKQLESFLNKSIKDLKFNLYERQASSSWSVIIVREPWARIKSAYKDKFVKGKKSHKVMYPEMFNGSSTADFPSFLHLLLKQTDQGPARLGWAQSTKYSMVGGNGHFIPAFGVCDPCHYRYDFILKVEHLETETTALFNYLNVTRGKVRLPELNKSPDPKGSNLEQKGTNQEEFIDDETKRMFEWLYKTDFELFGYKRKSGVAH